MDNQAKERREGSLEAPTRHPLNWRDPEFYNEEKLLQELERVYDICHGCRRCVNLCNAFPTLFDLVDNSPTLEVDGVDKKDYGKVVEQCYLCDLCYMTKCPYVPPHEWNVDFPHLMLQAKAVSFRKGDSRLRDRILTATDAVGSIAGIPVVAQAVNAVNKISIARTVMDKVAGIHPQAPLPEFHSNNLRKQERARSKKEIPAVATKHTRGRVALFVTCYGNRNAPSIVTDLIAVFEHNGIPVQLVTQERCCGMPKMELGDLEAVAANKEFNIPQLCRLVDEGYDLIAPIPSCVLMFKQELPLLFPEDAGVLKVQDAIYDPFEYLSLRHKDGKFDTAFKHPLGKIAYHVPCHQRVQNIGPRTKEILSLIPGTSLEVIERCSGHDGTYVIKSESHRFAMKIGRPVAGRVTQAEAQYYTSDCPLAAEQVALLLGDGSHPHSPFTLLRRAYGI